MFRIIIYICNYNIYMNVLFCRFGNKTNISEQLKALIPNHKKYVEPFAGSGALYFNKEPSKIEILNDIDKELMKGYKLIKKVSSDPEKYKDFDNKEDIQKFYNTKPTNNEDKLTHYIIKACNGFSGRPAKYTISKATNPHNKTKNIKEYKERMKKTKFTSKDYKEVIKENDSNETFFYLDPPYEDSSTLYKNYEIDYDELNNILSNIKGKFILSINDSPEIRNIFKKFKMKKIVIKPRGNKDININPRQELIILNY